jgi:putative transcriptional regulator
MINLDKILRVKPSGIPIDKGRLLVSGPLLHDFFFGRSVIFMTEYSNEGAMGFILNKKTDLFVSDLIEDFPELNIPVFAGGPVQSDSLFFIHKHANIIENSITVIDDLAFGGNFEQIQDYLSQGIMRADTIKFFLGYSGWDYKQLDNELEKESWIISTLKSTNEVLLADDNLWKKNISKFGSRYKNWLNFPENPTDN